MSEKGGEIARITMESVCFAIDATAEFAVDISFDQVGDVLMPPVTEALVFPRKSVVDYISLFFSEFKNQTLYKLPVPNALAHHSA